MTMPFARRDFDSEVAAETLPGLPPAIDRIAEAGDPLRAFLRRQWFAAAVEAYEGRRARTVLVARGGQPVAALPVVGIGPSLLGLASVPGSYWPYRGFPVAEALSPDEEDALLAELGRSARMLRIGPVYAGDPGLVALEHAAARAGWSRHERRIATSYLLDIPARRTEGAWPRGSTLKKNRFHEKHLASHGALEWEFHSGADWTPALFDALADVERRSWLSERTDGTDAKFTAAGHGRFWRLAAQDPRIAAMMWAALLRIDGRPMAFSFDLNLPRFKHAIANSYDPSVGKHSPGKLLYYRNLVRGLEDGLERVDWGAGDSGYKLVIGAEPGPEIVDILFAKPGAASLAMRLAGARWR